MKLGFWRLLCWKFRVLWTSKFMRLFKVIFEKHMLYETGLLQDKETGRAYSTVNQQPST